MRSSWLPVLLVVGCGSVQNAATPGDAGGDVDLENRTSDLPCDVEGVFARNCRSCHTSPPAYGAPMSLVTRDEIAANVDAIRDRVHRAPDAAGRMPQKPTPPLSESDLAVLDAWIAKGAPAGTCAPGKAEIPKAKRLDCKPNVSLRAASKFTMPKDKHDLYVCYGFDYDAENKQHITGIAPAIDNANIVHHVLLMQSDDAVSPTPYRCGAGIGQWRMLYAWAPGVGSFELPKEAGLPAEKGKTHFVVQTHYNNIRGLEGEVDDTGFDICATDTLRPNDADIVAFGAMKFDIPPRQTTDITATYLVPSSMNITAIGAFPHMHQLGTKIVTTVQPGGSGAPIDLGGAPSFDFGTQFFTPLPYVPIHPGDVVTTRCVWNNTTDRTVTWGENTEDEMCYAFTLYYPKITTDPWIWSLPAFVSAVERN